MEDIEKSKSELLAAGLSLQAINGVVQLSKTAHEKVNKENNEECVITALKLLEDIHMFMKTQSLEDQAIYKRIMQKKKGEIEAALAMKI